MSATPACAHRKPYPSPSPGVYRRRRPERSVLYQAVQENLETFLAQARLGEDTAGEALRAYVEREFRHYLKCGILAHGFARARCEACGHEFLVAFSCQRRGVCPCIAPPGAWHRAPRIWSITSSPRCQCANGSCHCLSDFAGICTVIPICDIVSRLKSFLEEIEQRLRTRGDDAPAGARLGAVSFIHRFGASLNPHVHFDEIPPWISPSGRTACVQIHSQWICHCGVTDGVFSPDGDGVRFHQSTLWQADMAALQKTIRRRVLRLAKRRGRLKPEQTEAMLGWSHGGGLMCAIPGAPASRALRASHFIPDEMVSVDAQVRIQAEDRRGLERLLRHESPARLRPGAPGLGR